MYSIVVHTPNNSLFFGLRGAGSSLAIVTDFLYRINTEPETMYMNDQYHEFKKSHATVPLTH